MHLNLHVQRQEKLRYRGTSIQLHSGCTFYSPNIAANFCLMRTLLDVLPPRYFKQDRIEYLVAVFSYTKSFTYIVLRYCEKK
jgi:hypothetical protein